MMYLFLFIIFSFSIVIFLYLLYELIVKILVCITGDREEVVRAKISDTITGKEYKIHDDTTFGLVKIVVQSFGNDLVKVKEYFELGNITTLVTGKSGGISGVSEVRFLCPVNDEKFKTIFSELIKREIIKKLVDNICSSDLIIEFGFDYVYELPVVVVKYAANRTQQIYLQQIKEKIKEELQCNNRGNLVDEFRI